MNTEGKLVAQSLKSQIYDKILKKIIDNEFPLNDLLVESHLTRMFNVSKAPVREALIELCSAGVLRNIPRAGYQIVRISESDIRNALQFRLLLEVEGLKLAFAQITDDDIISIRALAEESDKVRIMGLETDSVSEKMELNAKFHIALSKLSRNSFITKSLGETLNLLWRGLVQIMIHENRTPVPDTTYHSAIVRALEVRNLENAIKSLRNDILVYSNLGVTMNENI